MGAGVTLSVRLFTGVGVVPACGSLLRCLRLGIQYLDLNPNGIGRSELLVIIEISSLPRRNPYCFFLCPVIEIFTQIFRIFLTENPHLPRLNFPAQTPPPSSSSSLLTCQLRTDKMYILSYIFLTSRIVIYPMAAQPVRMYHENHSSGTQPAEAHSTDIMSALGEPNILRSELDLKISLRGSKPMHTGKRVEALSSVTAPREPLATKKL